MTRDPPLVTLLSGQYLPVSRLLVLDDPGGLGVLDRDGDSTGMEGDVDNGDGEFMRMEASELGDDKSSLLSGEDEGGEGIS